MDKFGITNNYHISVGNLIFQAKANHVFKCRNVQKIAKWGRRIYKDKFWIYRFNDVV